MADVAVKCKSGNLIKNGNLVTLPPIGGMGNLATNHVDDSATRVLGPALSDTDLDTKYDNRFDDIRYYTNDT